QSLEAVWDGQGVVRSINRRQRASGRTLLHLDPTMRIAIVSAFDIGRLTRMTRLSVCPQALSVYLLRPSRIPIRIGATGLSEELRLEKGIGISFNGFIQIVEQIGDEDDLPFSILDSGQFLEIRALRLATDSSDEDLRNYYSSLQL
ncbi:hypothetical protein CORC01_03906, partial [Colletotrichum orchidophilum]